MEALPSRAAPLLPAAAAAASPAMIVTEIEPVLGPLATMVELARKRLNERARVRVWSTSPPR